MTGALYRTVAPNNPCMLCALVQEMSNFEVLLNMDAQIIDMDQYRLSVIRDIDKFQLFVVQYLTCRNSAIGVTIQQSCQKIK